MKDMEVTLKKREQEQEIKSEGEEVTKPTEGSSVLQMLRELKLGSVAVDKHLEKASVDVVTRVEKSLRGFLKQLQGCLGLTDVKIITGLE